MPRAKTTQDEEGGEVLRENATLLSMITHKMENSEDLIDKESTSDCLESNDLSGSATSNAFEYTISPTKNALNEVSNSSGSMLETDLPDHSTGIDLADQFSGMYISKDRNDELEERPESPLSTAVGANSNPLQNTEDVDLPSNVTDRTKIFMPEDITPEDPRLYGKWMWFTNGDLDLMDYVWIQLAKLLLRGDIILMESSTARKYSGHFKGVVKCYTRGDKDSIRRAGCAIQNIINDDTIIYYKSNTASKNSTSNICRHRFISEYMLTVSGKLYKRDRLNRWKQVKDTEEGFTAEEISVFNEGSHAYEGTESLPSQEFRCSRYSYPEYSTLQEYSEVWSLACDATVTDNNGMTELDRMWIEAKKLVDEGVFTRTSCETKAVLYKANLPKKYVSFTVGEFCSIDKIIKSGDRLRERLSYYFPMYLKISLFDEYLRLKQRDKYLYTDDCNLYEYIDGQWKLLRNLL